MSEILLIDAEQPFANNMKSALEGRGFQVKQLDDGKDGLEYARSARPALIILCVELPKMSGYSICNKLKKDDDLRGIPLLITSSEATPETFAQHRKLKTRAEDYLIKPFDGSSLIEKIGELIPLPSGGASANNGEDSLSLDGLDDLEELNDPPRGEVALSSDELDALSIPGDDDAGLGFDDLDSLGDDLGGDLGSGSSSDSSLDDGLGSLGDDFNDLDNLTGEPIPADASGEEALEALDAAFEDLAPLPDVEAETTSPQATPPPPEPAPRASLLPQSAGPSQADLEAMGMLRRENTDLKVKVSELEARLKGAEESAKQANAALNDTKSSSVSSSRDSLELKKEIRAKEKEIMDLKDEILKKDEAVVEIEEQLERVRADTQSAVDGVAQKDTEIASLQARVDAVTEERDALETQVRDRLANAEREAADLRGRIDDAESASESARREASSLKSELDATKGKVSSAEKEARDAKDQLVDAYNRVKSEERVREKAKKAVEIAYALLQGDVEVTDDSDLEMAELDA